MVRMSAFQKALVISWLDVAFVQVVPTIYVNSHNHTINSNQYSVTEHFKISYDYHAQLPGVFFYYDLSPIKVGICELF